MMDYKKAGVDIEAGYKSVELMKEHVKKTMRAEVLGGLGGFSGAFNDICDLFRIILSTGNIVHYVDEGVDSGPILLQKAVEVQPGDTPQVLQRRVMEQAEWVILPEAVNRIANGLI